jgi:lysophospholipase L1-like esterase
MARLNLFGLGLNAIILASSAVVGGGYLAGANAFGQEVLVKNGEKIAFLGDSITQQGAGFPGGYVQLVMSGLEANGIKAVSIPAGIGGHKSPQMLERLERDVLSKKPEWMLLSCGVNDVMHQGSNNGVMLEPYKANITQILDKCKAAGVKVLVATATMIGEDPAGSANKTLEPYNAFLRDQAKERGLPLADLNAEMQAAVLLASDGGKRKGNHLTGDGVHMNLLGNRTMALGVLRGFGLDAAGIAKAEAHWDALPGTGQVSLHLPLTYSQHQALTKQAAAKNKSVQELIVERTMNDLKSTLSESPAMP